MIFYKSGFFLFNFSVECINRLSTSQQAQTAKQDIPPSTIDLECAYYDMIHEQRGLAIILNHFKFESKKYRGLERNGTEVDCERLIKTFLELNFKVKVYNDLKREEINAKLEKGNIMSNIMKHV